MVAISGLFLGHFRLHFQVIFLYLVENGWKMKCKMMWKMATVNTLECQNKNGAKMDFNLCLAVLGTFKLHRKGLHEIVLP
jgi:hypothetical protein